MTYEFRYYILMKKKMKLKTTIKIIIFRNKNAYILYNINR